MVKLKAMPFRAIVDELAGKLDFYCWMGIPVCRTWPSAPGRKRNPLVMMRAGRFRYINCESTDWPAAIRGPYQELALDTAFSWRDWAVRLYVNAEIDFYEWQG